MWKASDGVGSIEVMEVFGNDLTVVNSARVSFAKESHELTLGDEKLIKYLAAHNHISPFFHPQYFENAAQTEKSSGDDFGRNFNFVFFAAKLVHALYHYGFP